MHKVMEFYMEVLVVGVVHVHPLMHPLRVSAALTLWLPKRLGQIQELGKYKH